MRATILLPLATILIFGAPNTKAQLVIVSREAKSLAAYAPPPQYPRVARMAGVSGQGAAMVTVDPHTGLVTSVRMSPSTGDKDLDQAALKAFRKWRFKTGQRQRISIPIQFNARQTSIAPVGNESLRAIYAPLPVYPAEARSKRLAGMGIVVVDVDPQSGYVTAVRMLQSTGSTVLDEPR